MIYLKWALVMLVNLLGFITAPIIYPLLYPLRNTFLRRLKPFWFYFDDEDGDLGTDWFIEAKGYHLKTAWNRFRCAYHWSAIRNPAWNLQASLKPRKGMMYIIKSKGRLIKDYKPVALTEMAVLKYVDAEGNYKDNVGEFLSYKYSILGKAFLIFAIGESKYFRYSYANKWLFGLWYELQIGVTDKRYTFRLKIKKTKVKE